MIASLFFTLVLKSLFVFACVGVVSLMINNVARLAMKRRVPFIFGVALFLAIYIAAGWAAFQAKAPLAAAVPWLAALVVALAAGNMALALRGGLRLGALVPRCADARYAVLALLVFCAAQSLTIADIRLPLMDFGNVDVWYYAKVARVVLDPAANNRPDLDLVTSLATHATPGAFLLLAGLASLTGSDVIDTLAVAMSLILTASFILTQQMCRRQFGMASAPAAVVAAAAAFTGFQVYLVGHFFLAQLLAALCFVGLLFVVFWTDTGALLRLLTASFLMYILLMTYPGLFPAYAAMFLFVALAYNLAITQLGSASVPWKPLAACFAAPFMAVAAIAATDLHHLKALSSIMSMYSQTSSLGWAFGLANPLLFVLGTFYPPDLWPTATKLAGYCLVAVAVAVGAVAAFRQDRVATGNAHPAPAGDLAGWLTLVLLFLGCLIGYLTYYAIAGVSYQQWKLAASTLSPLAFVPLALAWKLICPPWAPAWRSAWLVVPAAAAAVMTVSAFQPILSWSWPLAPKYAPLQALRGYDDAAAIKGFYVFAESDPRGLLMISNFLNRKPTVLFDGARAPLPKLWRDEAPAGGLAVVSDFCPPDGRAQIVRLGAAFCMLTDFRLGEGYDVLFGPTPGGWVGLTGMSPPEPWGAWNHASRVTISTLVNPQWRKTLIGIHGKPFTLPGCVPHQRVILHANGQWLREVTISAETTIDLIVPHELFAGRGLIELSIEFPDAVSPQTCGASSDSRALAFAFYRLIVRSLD